MNEIDAAAAILAAEGWTTGGGPAPAILEQWWRASEHPDAGCGHAAEPDAALIGIVGIPGICWCPTDGAAVFDAHRAAEPGCDQCDQLTPLSVVMWRIHERVAVMAAMCADCLNPTTTETENPQ